MRGLPSALLTALLVGPPCAATPVRAQEPLFLHIRPNNVPLPESAVSGQRLSDAQLAERARSASEAVWQRAERRARIAIASVCSGCLPAERPSPSVSPVPLPIRAADATPSDSRPRTEGDL